MVASDDLDSLFRAGQPFLANLNQLHPFLVANDQFFQHHFAGFHLLDDLLKPIHGAFEVELRFGLFWSGGHISGKLSIGRVDKKRDFGKQQCFIAVISLGACAESGENTAINRINSCLICAIRSGTEAEP
jgi:hypothetical protein